MYDNLRHTLDIDDLLFEKRNKDYGAYQLRKRYNSVVIAGILIGSLVVTTIVIIPFLMMNRKDKVVLAGIHYVKVQMDNLDPPVDVIVVPPPPPPPEAARISEQVKYVPPEVVDSVPPLERSLATADEAAEITSSENAVVNGTGTNEDLTFGQDGTETDEPLFQVEIMPSFRGGDVSKFRTWIGTRTSVPQEAIDKKIRGTVFLTFIVEKDGSVSNVSVVKGVDPLLDDVAVKAISESPKWTPGLQRGQPVRVRFSIPLKFMF